MRDHHMKEKYLETNKAENQFAKFTIKSVSLPASGLPKAGEVNAKISGSFSMHGKTNDITLDTKLKLSDTKLSGSPVFKIKLSDFAIAIPSFAGVTVAEDVEITVNLQATAN